MRKVNVRDLSTGTDSPVFAGTVPGFVVERGGVSRYEPGSRTHPEGRHVHDVPEVFTILQGSGVIEIDGVPTPFEAGDVFIVEPGEDHHLLSQGPLPLASMWAHLQPGGDCN